MIALVLDIITTAAILFVVASGLLIVLGVLKIVNFAHGAFLTMGGYSALLITHVGWSPWIAFPAAFVIGCAAGALVETFIMRPIYDRPLDAILATWGLGIVIGQLITIAFGREIQFVQTPISGAASFLGETYSLYRLFLVVAALLVGGGIAALFSLTRLGLEARAVIMNEHLARALGINSAFVRFVTFCFGAGLASLAGALITPLSSVDPGMGVPWLVNAFMLVLVSSVSLVSLATAALVLGGAQVVVSTFVSPVVGGLTIVVLAALILRIRPQGFSHD
jgi:branched-subunit amino acid ABC-type transport system permease component